MTTTTCNLPAELTSRKYDMYKTAMYRGEFVAIIGCIRSMDTLAVLDLVIRTIDGNTLTVQPTEMTNYCL